MFGIRAFHMICLFWFLCMMAWFFGDRTLEPSMGKPREWKNGKKPKEKKKKKKKNHFFNFFLVLFKKCFLCYFWVKCFEEKHFSRLVLCIFLPHNWNPSKVSLSMSRKATIENFKNKLVLRSNPSVTPGDMRHWVR